MSNRAKIESACKSLGLKIKSLHYSHESWSIELDDGFKGATLPWHNMKDEIELLIAMLKARAYMTKKEATRDAD